MDTAGQEKQNKELPPPKSPKFRAVIHPAVVQQLVASGKIGHHGMSAVYFDNVSKKEKEDIDFMCRTMANSAAIAVILPKWEQYY